MLKHVEAANQTNTLMLMLDGTATHTLSSMLDIMVCFGNMANLTNMPWHTPIRVCDYCLRARPMRVCNSNLKYMLKLTQSNANMANRKDMQYLMPMHASRVNLKR